MHNRRQNIGELLKKSVASLKETGRDSAYVDCLLLLSETIGKSKEYIISHPETTLDQADQARFLSHLERLIQGEPLAYILGRKEFFNHTFLCSPACLIPRPETELIVETALEIFASGPPSRFLDLGTGTGAIGISLASSWKGTKAILTDIQLEALVVARENCKRILGSRASDVTLVCSDWFSGLSKKICVDLIAVNPPYVSPHDSIMLDKNVKFYEPERALFARDERGLSEIKEIFSNAPDYLSKKGVILCEIGLGQADEVFKFITGLGDYEDIEILKDLSGIDRVVVARLKGR